MPGPFGSGPFGDTPFGGTPEGNFEAILVGFQSNAALGLLGDQVSVALLGLQSNAALGLLGDQVSKALVGLQSTTALGVFVEEEIVALHGFAIPTALGILLAQITLQNPTLTGLESETRLGMLFPASINKLIHAALSDRAVYSVSIGDR